MSGYVYALTNYYMPGLVKIGMTKKDPVTRAIDCSRHTGVPEYFELAHKVACSNYKEAESEVHKIASEFRVRKRREFFKIDLDEAKSLINCVCDRINEESGCSRLLPVKTKESEIDEVLRDEVDDNDSYIMKNYPQIESDCIKSIGDKYLNDIIGYIFFDGNEEMVPASFTHRSGVSDYAKNNPRENIKQFFWDDVARDVLAIIEDDAADCIVNADDGFEFADFKYIDDDFKEVKQDKDLLEALTYCSFPFESRIGLLFSLVPISERDDLLINIHLNVLLEAGYYLPAAEAYSVNGNTLTIYQSNITAAGKNDYRHHLEYRNYAWFLDEFYVELNVIDINMGGCITKISTNLLY